MQISMFDGSKRFLINKPIRLIELFGGYGSQHLALEYLGANFEQWKLCEWAVKSIQAYKDMHILDDKDYSKEHSDEYVVNRLTKWGVSANYNEPMTKSQIKRMGIKRCRQIYNNIKATNNLVNIQQVSGEQLELLDIDDYTYIVTYSFPCQDLSKAGQGKGMEKGSGTRSGMLWEVERILDECNKTKKLPQVLLMENVPDVIGVNNVKHFAKWLEKLENLGYKCYFKILNAKDYGIPQNRERCFMVSILGDYYYEFPQPKELKIKLKDVLEEDVDEKFYLSDKIGNEYPITKNNENFIEWKQDGFLDSDCRAWKDSKISGTLTTNGKNKICETNLKRQLCNNLTINGRVQEYDVIRHSYSTSRINGEMKDIQQNNMSPTLDTRCDCLGVVVNNSSDKVNLRIRKLTPKECFRLMGVKDYDFKKITQNQSNASLYHLAGDSIVTAVLMAIFGEMLGINWEEKIEEIYKSWK